MIEEIKEHLMKAVDSQIDESMKPFIAKWNKDTPPIDVLYVIDHSVHGGLASKFIMQVLNLIYDDVCKQHNTTHEEVVKQATWRV